MRLPRYYGWRVVAAVWATFLVNFGVIYYAYGVFFVRWEEEYGWSRALIGGIQTVVNLTVALLGPFFGTLSDRVSTQRLLTGGILLFGTGMMLVSAVRTPWQLYLCYMVAAVGLASSGHVILISLVSRWFHYRRGLALGLAETGMGMGGMTMVPLAGVLVEAVDWRWAIRALVVMMWAIVLPLVLFVVRTAPGPRDVEPQGPAHRAGAATSRPWGLSVGQAMRTWQLWCLVAAMTCGGLASSGAFTHLLPFMKDEGISVGLASVLFSLAAAAMLVAKLSFGYFSDRASPKGALVLALVLGALVTLVELAVVLWSPPMGLTLLAAAGVGAVAGSFTVIMPTLIGALFGPRHLGSILGTVFLFAMSGMAVGPLVAGWLFDSSGSYKSYFYLMLALYGMAFLTAMVLRPVSGARPLERP